MVVTDVLLSQTTSAPVDLRVLPSSHGHCGRWLLVSSHDSDTVEQSGGVLGTYRRTLVPAGSGGLNGTSDLTCGPDGDLYVSSQLNHSILRYDGETGAFIDVFVSSGSGALSYPNSRPG